MMDLIDRQAAIDAVQQHRKGVLGSYEYDEGVAFVYAAAHNHIIEVIKRLPSAQQEYEPVTAEDFAKTMSENTLYSFMGWHGKALTLMKEYGFVICKRTM